MNEELLVSQLKEGSVTAFKLLMEEFKTSVYNTALGMVQNVEDAEDVSQEVFVEVYRSVKNFKGEAKLSTWIYRITITKSLEHLRSKNRKKRFGFIQSLFVAEGVTPIRDIPHFNHPGVLLENKERAKVLFAAIEQLPENQKTAFILHKVEGVSYQEIADVMRISLSSVESLQFRAKQNLQKLLKGYYENDW